MSQERIDDVRSRLESIAEDITDIAVDMLREAVDQGATQRPPEEKKLAAARRAIEKALRSLE